MSSGLLSSAVESVTGLFERVAESFRSTNENEDAASEGGRGGTPTPSGDGEAQAQPWVDYSSSGQAEVCRLRRQKMRIVGGGFFSFAKNWTKVMVTCV
jgi:hypothetical protein